MASRKVLLYMADHDRQVEGMIRSATLIDFNQCHMNSHCASRLDAMWQWRPPLDGTLTMRDSTANVIAL